MNVATYINQLIIKGAQQGISDIHFKPDREQVEVYFRLNGQISYYQNLDHRDYRQLLRYIKYKSKLDLGLSQVPQDGSYTLEANGDEIFVRISTIPLIYSESLVIRILVQQVAAELFEVAYIPSDLQKIYEQIVSATGLFVFTGPTGSGKSTSMYALLEAAAKEANKKIICIEDPVEVINQNFIQIQINERGGLTYGSALKACLRHDPDIIMIGEIRDEETAKSVFRASLTGHTVISTMHTKNKYGVIERFLDFDFKLSEITSVLIGISTQRLILDQNGDIKAYYDYVLSDQINDLVTNRELVTIQDKLQLLGLYANKQ